SRFQDVGWTIILSIARKDVMAALDDFKKTFPFITLLFLLIISYLSLLFIRKGLDPLHILQKGTQRIARKDFTTPVEIDSKDEFEDLGRSFNQMMGNLDSHFQALTVLNEIDRAILSSLDRKEIVATTLQRLKNFFKCEVAAYVKKSEESVEYLTVYRLEGRRVDDPVIAHYQVSPDEQLQIFTDADHSCFSPETARAGFFREISGARPLQFLCFPLSVKQKTQRALLLGYNAEHSFSEDQLAQARKIANQLAIALANSMLVDELGTLAKGTIAALARTVDAKSKWTHGHSERVAEISVKIAKAMQLSDEMVESIGRAGLLHDIGKIGIPLAILDKPERLTDEEYDNIKNHPSIGAQILEPIEAYRDIIPIIRQHHEKFDGTGYPAGLEKERIDIRARIMAVADVWDALVSDRPYREGWVSKRAKEVILDGKGSHFDPKVVDVFMTLLAEKQGVFSI
ncbi:MAG: HD domain-containing protein, partial [Desulfarculaceae bacterium]|nr:HD domain-containing protein [Desulfarculaceae bacterium]